MTYSNKLKNSKWFNINNSYTQVAFNETVCSNMEFFLSNSVQRRNHTLLLNAEFNILWPAKDFWLPTSQLLNLKAWVPTSAYTVTAPKKQRYWLKTVYALLQSLSSVLDSGPLSVDILWFSSFSHDDMKQFVSLIKFLAPWNVPQVLLMHVTGHKWLMDHHLRT